MAGPGPGSGLTKAQLRSRVKDQATFAEDDAVVDQWVNEKHKQLVTQSGWSTAIVTIGNTVAAQAAYDLDPNIADLAKLRVGSAPYRQVGLDQIWDLQNADSILTGFGGGVFAPSYKADGTQQVTIFPTPDTSGVAITALASLTPADLGDVSGDSEYPVAPEDLHEAIADGAIALGFRLRSENAPEAAEFENRFQAAIELLRRRKNSRVGTGAVQIQIRGVHFT